MKRRDEEGLEFHVNTPVRGGHQMYKIGKAGERNRPAVGTRKASRAASDGAEAAGASPPRYRSERPSGARPSAGGQSGGKAMPGGGDFVFDERLAGYDAYADNSKLFSDEEGDAFV